MRYTSLLRFESLFWKSFVMEKNTSVASVFVNVSPCVDKYSSRVRTC